MNSEKGAFDGLPEDDLDSTITGAKDLSKLDAVPAPTAFIENCKKCRGSGRFTSWAGRDVGPCRACNGTGKQSFKTSATDRAARKTAGAASQVRKADANLEAFKAQHPAVFAWMDGSTFDFAVQMREAIRKYGNLTERQLAACQRLADKLTQVKAESVARVENAKTIDLTKIDAAFAKASAVLKSPKLRVAGLIISHAKAESKNAGALYIKSAEIQNAEGYALYLGKIMGGKFIRSRDCTDAQEAALMDVAHDPMAAAIAYGRLTGNCACCGKALTNKESVERGIGPVCAEKFGW